MNMVKIVCPNCSAEKKLSLVDSCYTGPQRCWKCHELFTVTIYNNQVRSCEPLRQEEYDQPQIAGKDPGKMGGDIEPSRQAEPEIPALIPERRRDYSKPFSYGANSGGAEPDIPSITPKRQRDYSKPFNYGANSGEAEPERPATKNPPDRFRTFVPLEDTPEEPSKPQTPKTPPDRFRTFIPPAT
jgi:hypothetical protein